MSTRRHVRKHEALLRLWSWLITPVTPDFFDRKVDSCYLYIQRHWVFQQGLSTRPAIPWQADVARAFQSFLQLEHWLVGLLTGTSWNFRKYQVTNVLPGCFKCSSLPSWNKRESLTGKSWEFSDIASDTSEWMEVWYSTSCWRGYESRGFEQCTR